VGDCHIFITNLGMGQNQSFFMGQEPGPLP
jgi:hypothetical protein